MPATRRTGGICNLLAPVELQLELTNDLQATVVDLTRRLDAITAKAQAAADSAGAPHPLQPALKQAPRYSLKMTQRHGPVAVSPPTAEFYVDASGNPTHQKE